MERNESGSGDAYLQTIWRYYTDFDERERRTSSWQFQQNVCVNEKYKFYYATPVPNMHL